MKLAVFNGSPKGKGSNTKILLDHFLRGFGETGGNQFELFYLIRKGEFEKSVDAFKNSEHTLIAFPLYTDCMPGVVKFFIEALEPLCGQAGNPALGFIVQSGFSESIHSHNVRRYLEKLCRRLGSEYLGTVIKGGCEGIQSQPERFNRKLFSSFYELGRIFGLSGVFDQKIVSRLARPVQYSALGLLAGKLFAKIGEIMYWDRMLKKNGAYEKRFAKPYASNSLK
ncbi:MAG TPA: hypothetical protein VM123_13170 [archaeon]|nr:hypothetical protein [archaeon]